MKHIKLFEDYSDEDLAGLISDLDGVGLIDKTIVSFEVKIPIPHQSAHPSWWPEPYGKFAIVEVSSPEKSPNVEQMAFEKIKKGDFTQDLSELNSDAYREGIPSILKFFSSESIQKEAQESRNVGEFKIRIHEKTGQILFNEWEILVDDHLNGRPEAEVKEFFDTPWKSTPKSAKLAITKCIEIKVSKNEVKT